MLDPTEERDFGGDSGSKAVGIGRFSGRTGPYTPSVGLFGNYNFRDLELDILTNGVKAEQIGFGATVQGGLGLYLVNGAKASVNGTYGLFQDDVQSWSVTGNIVIPLN